MTLDDGKLPVFDEAQLKTLVAQLHCYLLKNVDLFRELIVDDEALLAVEKWVVYGARLGYFFRELETQECFERLKDPSS